MEDPVTVLVVCDGHLFLAIGQVNAIKINGQYCQSVQADLLSKETVTLGLQILQLKSSNLTLANGKQADWVWEHGVEASLSILVHRISPDIGRMVLEDSQPLSVYAFHSDDLQELAASMYCELCTDELKSLPKVKMTDHYPYHFQGEYPQGSFHASSMLKNNLSR